VAFRDKSNPYVGLKGFWNRWNRITYNFSGAAQVGLGRGGAEAPDAAASEAVCPLCGKPMEGHRFERSTDRTPTRMICPD
jgi:hypothetical protein